MYSLLWLTFESSVGLPQELHTWERCWSSSVRVCLNINGVGLDTLLHIVTDTSINIIWAPNGFNGSDGATGKKLLWVWTDAESDGRSGEQMASRELAVFYDGFSFGSSLTASGVKMMSARCQRCPASSALGTPEDVSASFWCSRCPLCLFSTCRRE